MSRRTSIPRPIVQYPHHARFTGDHCKACRFDASLHVTGDDGCAHCPTCPCNDHPDHTRRPA